VESLPAFRKRLSVDPDTLRGSLVDSSGVDFFLKAWNAYFRKD